MLLHCLFLHLYSGHTDDRLWNLACDMAVENLIEKQKMPRLSDGKKGIFCEIWMKIPSQQNKFMSF